MYTYYFEKLDVWKDSQDFAVKIYRITSRFPKEEMYGLVSQMRRSSVSISSNIAEGVSRETNKDKARFLVVSYSSAIEVLNQLMLSESLGFIDKVELGDLRLDVEKITNKLHALKKRFNSVTQ